LSGKGGIKGKKIAKEKRPSEQRLSITFSIASNLEIAWIAVKIYFTDRDVECENQVQSNVCGCRRASVNLRLPIELVERTAVIRKLTCTRSASAATRELG
jgi:hypothetical protein